MQAYAAAGISIARTSQDQWAWGPQVSTPEPGDLVFFAGADGTVTSPGHVGDRDRPAHDDRGLRDRLPDPVLPVRHRRLTARRREPGRVHRPGRARGGVLMRRRGRLTRDQKLIVSAVAAGLLLAAGHGQVGPVHAAASLSTASTGSGSSNEQLANSMAASGYGWTGGAGHLPGRPVDRGERVQRLCRQPDLGCPRDPAEHQRLVGWLPAGQRQPADRLGPVLHRRPVRQPVRRLGLRNIPRPELVLSHPEGDPQCR